MIATDDFKLQACPISFKINNWYICKTNQWKCWNNHNVYHGLGNQLDFPRHNIPRQCAHMIKFFQYVISDIYL